MRILLVGIAAAAALIWWMNRPLCSCSYKETAMMAAVRADLRNLVTAQESYFADHYRYTRSLDSLDFDPSSGVTVAFQYVSDSAWSVVGIHRDVSGWCTMFIGDVTPPIDGSTEGEPACRWTAAGNQRQRGMPPPTDGG